MSGFVLFNIENACFLLNPFLCALRKNLKERIFNPCVAEI